MNFSGLGFSIANSAFGALSQALDVYGNNVANANTPGYSQEVADLSEGIPLDGSGVAAGQIGTGVRLVSISRMRDEYLDLQTYYQNMILGQNESLNDVYNQLKVIFPDAVSMTATGLSAAMSQFFTDWSALAADPSSGTLRSNLMNDAVSMSSLFNSTAKQLVSEVTTVNQQISSDINQVNSYLTQIASLNQSITVASGNGQNPNQLLDQRNLLITNLSELINFSTVTLSDNTITLQINGIALVQGGTANQLSACADPNNPSFIDVGWRQGSASSTPTYDLTSKITGGKIGGLIQSRTSVLLPLQSELNQIASSMITQVNTYHEAGYNTTDGTTYGIGINTEIPFFDGTNAQSICVNPAIQDNVSLIAASKDLNPVTGAVDGQNADLIAGLQDVLLNSNEQSVIAMNFGKPGRIDPAMPMSWGVTTAINGAGTNLTNFSLAPNPAGGTLSVDGVAVPWLAGQSLNTIINNINLALGGQAFACFNTTTQEVTFTGSQQVILRDVSGNLTTVFRAALQLYSATNINIEPGPNQMRVDPAMPMNINPSPATDPVNLLGYNEINFFVAPSQFGTVSVNNNPIAYTDATPINTIVGAIQGIPGFGTSFFNTATQQLVLRTSPAQGISVEDIGGNFNEFMQMPPTGDFSDVYNDLISKVSDGATAVTNNLTTANGALTQIQNNQDSVAKVNIDQQDAIIDQLGKTAEAVLRYEETLNELLNVLINGMGSNNNNNPSSSSPA